MAVRCLRGFANHQCHLLLETWRGDRVRFLKTAAKNLLGHERARKINQFVRRVANVGLARRCPCCEASVRRFLPFGVGRRREEAQCPICGSLERHRLIWLYVTQRTDFFDGKRKKVLHIAPEPQLSRLFKSPEYIDYLSADLFDPHAMVKMDITDIQYPDNTFDVIYCSHVLEHVSDDRKAMREFHRVLKDGGWAILQVPFPETTLCVSAPMMDDFTFEDPTVTSPNERERVYGQFDHVRRYGRDYGDRLAEAGFSVSIDSFVRELSEREAKRFGLMRTEDVYFCRKERSSG